jgi:histone deacetylase 1/2
MTRFDLTFALGKLSKYVANPGAVHWTALKRLLRYIQGTLDHGIEFVWHGSAPGALTLSAFCDSSYGDDSDTARSTNGYAFFYGDTPILASSKLTTRVDSCINHAEFRAFVSAADDAPEGDYDGINFAFVKTTRNAVWLRGTAAALNRTNIAAMPPTPVRTDNNGVLSILATVTLPQANRHIWKTIAEARERVHLDHAVLPVKVDTCDNVADCLTKPATKSSKHMRALAHPRSGGTDPDAVD